MKRQIGIIFLIIIVIFISGCYNESLDKPDKDVRGNLFSEDEYYNFQLELSCCEKCLNLSVNSNDSDGCPYLGGKSPTSCGYQFARYKHSIIECESLIEKYGSE